MSRYKRIKLLIRGDNQSVCTNIRACGRKVVACIQVGTTEIHNLKGEVATDWHVDHSV